MANKLNHNLLDEFLGHVLDRYKAGDKNRLGAIADLAHLVAALDLPDGQGDDPNAYMKAILAGEGEDD